MFALNIAWKCVQIKMLLSKWGADLDLSQLIAIYIVGLYNLIDYASNQL